MNFYESEDEDNSRQNSSSREVQSLAEVSPPIVTSSFVQHLKARQANTQLSDDCPSDASCIEPNTIIATESDIISFTSGGSSLRSRITKLELSVSLEFWLDYWHGGLALVSGVKAEFYQTSVPNPEERQISKMTVNLTKSAQTPSRTISEPLQSVSSFVQRSLAMEESLYSPPGSAPLGASIPNLPHALSVSLPTWQDNVDWAEANARVVDVMSTGYPRFFVQRNIQKLARLCLEAAQNQTDTAMLFPTERTARECIPYMKRMEPRSSAQMIHFELHSETDAPPPESGVELYAVFFRPELWKIAKSFWQHAGMGISSRYADMILDQLEAGYKLDIVEKPPTNELNMDSRAQEEKCTLRRRIANLINDNRCRPSPSLREQSLGNEPAEEDHVFLYPTGMAAIWHAHQLSLAFSSGSKCICFGFSYTDTIKVIDRWGSGSANFFDGPDTNLEALEKFLPNCPTAALFCEVPSNPLLQTPNLPRLRALADRFGFLIVVDETVGNFINVDVFRYADIITTSLSKLFSGSANVMGGSLVINPNSSHFSFMSAHLKKTYVDDYYYEDAVVMEANSRNFVERVVIINANAVAVCEFLRTRSLTFAGPHGPNPSSDWHDFVIKDVFFPKWVTRENYDLCRKPGAEDSFGPLFSLTFTSPEASHAFFNSLQCAKGPSLGTNFTLACPYTILAHYNERPWAAAYGIEEGIVRLSVGMEGREVLMEWIHIALMEAERYSTMNTCSDTG
ncbi:STR2_2 [Sanghuangporus sanghuang]